MPPTVPPPGSRGLGHPFLPVTSNPLTCVPAACSETTLWFPWSDTVMQPTIQTPQPHSNPSIPHAQYSLGNTLIVLGCSRGGCTDHAALHCCLCHWWNCLLRSTTAKAMWPNSVWVAQQALSNPGWSAPTDCIRPCLIGPSVCGGAMQPQRHPHLPATSPRPVNITSPAHPHGPANRAQGKSGPLASLLKYLC